MEISFKDWGMMINKEESKGAALQACRCAPFGLIVTIRPVGNLLISIDGSVNLSKVESGEDQVGRQL